MTFLSNLRRRIISGFVFLLVVGIIYVIAAKVGLLPIGENPYLLVPLAVAFIAGFIFPRIGTGAASGTLKLGVVSTIGPSPESVAMDSMSDRDFQKKISIGWLWIMALAFIFIVILLAVAVSNNII